MILSVLALVLPLALVGAVSPVMLSQQTVLLSRPDGRRLAIRYALGVAATLLIIVTTLVFFGRSIALPDEPRLSAGLDVGLGAALLAVAGLVLARHRSHRSRPRVPKQRSLGPNAALGLGVFSMLTNLTTITVLVPVAKEIAASGLGVIAQISVALVVVAVAALPAWLPVALSVAAPGPADRGLRALAGLLERHGSQLVVGLLTALGAFLVGRGVVHLLGG